MNGASALVKTLSNHGVSTVFAYPGGTIMPVYDALLDSPVEHILCRHEQGAAFAAIGYARSSGRPGVCIATIRRKSLPVKIVLLDNQRLGMVRQWQELFFAGRYSETDLSDNPDFITLAKAFDIPGRTITQRQEVLPALAEMLQANTSWLLHVCIDETENVWPLVPPGAGNHEMMEESL